MFRVDNGALQIGRLADDYSYPKADAPSAARLLNSKSGGGSRLAKGPLQLISSPNAVMRLVYP